MTLALLAMLPLACHPVDVQSCEADIASHMAVLPEVRLATSGDAATWVTYAASGETDLQTDTTTGLEHTHYLRGMPAETKVAWQAWMDDGDGPQAVCDGTVTTGSLPSDLPAFTVSVSTPETLDDGTLYLGAAWHLFGETPYLVVFDRKGVVRWYVAGPAESMIVDSQAERRGQDILFNYMDGQFGQDIAAIDTVTLDGLPVRSLTTPLGHHMFLQLPDGRLAYQVLDIRDWEDPETGETRSVVGDAIAEIHPDGTIETVASVWDWAEMPSPAYPVTYGIYGTSQDWSHGNALRYDDDTDEYLLSLGNLGIVAEVDRATGQPSTLYGRSGITVYGSPPYAHQHDPTLLGNDTLTVFATDNLIPSSGAVGYEIDRDAGHLVEAWRHGFQPGDFAPMLGQVTTLPGGHVRVNYGGGGQIEEIDSGGNLVWRIDLDTGDALAQVSEFAGFWPDRDSR